MLISVLPVDLMTALLVWSDRFRGLIVLKRVESNLPQVTEVAVVLDPSVGGIFPLLPDVHA